MPIVMQEEAMANLPRLIDDVAERGGEIVVTRDRIAIAKIVPVVAAATHTPTHRRHLSREEWLALSTRRPPVEENGPAPSDESLRRENLYEDRS